MKKILAVMMAIVMMMAIPVPAFAADITTSGGTGNTTITTKTDGQGDGSFTVTIPAGWDIPWDATTTDVPYSVSSQLATGKTVQITVEGSGKMTKANVGEITYTLTNAVHTTTKAVVTSADPDYAAKVTVNVLAKDWDAASIDNYTDTLTFTAIVI